MEKPISPLIDATDLKHIVGNGDVVLVDARGGPDAAQRYAAGHLRNARMVNLETDLSDIGPDAARGGRHPLPEPKRFGVLLGNLGITPTSHVIVYDDKGGANAAARFWWMMRAAGHQIVQVIDGGLAAIQQAGLKVVQGPPPTTPGTSPYPFTDWALPLVNIDTIDSMRSAEDSLVIDVREPYRYRGESEPIDLIAGHIPGAVNVPYVDNLRADGRFRTPDELRKMYTEVIGEKDIRNVAVHCGSGVTACHTLLAMDAAGLPTPRLYVGSWSEWSRNDKPVGAGQQP